MKHLSFILLACSAMLAQAQSNTNLNVYGFRQRVSPGIKAVGDIDETGKLVKKESAPLFNYLFFATATSSENVHPLQLWVMGKVYAVKTDTLEKAPQVYKTNAARVTGAEPLLPETNGLILRLWPVDDSNLKKDPKARRRAKANDLVLVYKTKNGVQYGVLKKFTNLPHNTLQ